jgi:hypothetical protein
MGFIDKYREFQLEDVDLLAYYELEDDSDSGPNSNDLIELSSPPISWGSPVSFDENLFSIPCGDQDKFSSFILFNKNDVTKTSVLVSNYDSEGYLFGFSPNFDFFIYAKDGSNSVLRIFKDIKAAANAMIVFSRDGYNFSLSLYSPLTGDLKSESIAIPNYIDLGSADIKIGMDPAESPPLPFATSKFNLYKFGLISVGVPQFVLIELCKEIVDSTDLVSNDFKFSFISTKEKVDSLTLQGVLGNTGKDTNIVLPYSNTVDGFVLLGQSLKTHSRFFQNENEVVPSIFDTYVRFSGQSSLDFVVLDNFDIGAIAGSFTSFNGSLLAKVPYMAPVIISNFKREVNDFVTLDSGNLCFNKNIIFPGNTSLTKI